MAFTHAVVTFKSDNLPKIVPIKWLVKGNSECYYPNSSVHKRIKKAVKSCSDVHPDWKIFECCVVKYFGIKYIISSHMKLAIFCFLIKKII